MEGASNDAREPRPDDLLLRCRFPQDKAHVSVAVSGGCDSMALLVLAVAAGHEVEAIHVDHGLRPESANEAAVVAAAAARFGAAFRSERVDIDDGPNLEARARAARYAVLPPDVMTGHTLDDLAETILLNLLRGAGLDGLTPFHRNSRVQRPILALRRSETAALCAGLRLDTVDDPSNRDPRFARNRVRHELIPLMREIADRDVSSVLARQAATMADDAALLDQLAADLDPTDAASVAGAPPALARRALRRWLRSMTGGNPPDSEGITRVMAVARGEVRAAEVAGGIRVARRQGRLFVES